ncbi:MAG: DUF2970 domain-containing protein [Betaproteobacteria bacterium]|nr:DUF2970 domain-containing protein [Betaproteobacteria bacterium]
MKEASFLDTVKTVLWGFVGIRRKSAHESARVKPAHVIALAVILVVLFVLTLRTIVGFITR